MSTKQTSKKKVPATKKKEVSTKLKSVLNRTKIAFTNLLKKTKNPLKNTKKHYKNVIMGVGLLLVVVSISYSTYIIYIGVDSDASRLALLPQALFAVIITFKAFSKLYK